MKRRLATFVLMLSMLFAFSFTTVSTPSAEASWGVYGHWHHVRYWCSTYGFPWDSYLYEDRVQHNVWGQVIGHDTRLVATGCVLV